MPDLKTLNSQSWDDRLEARAHTYQLRGRFAFAHDALVKYQPKKWLDIGTGNGFLPNVTRDKLECAYRREPILRKMRSSLRKGLTSSQRY
ncbi:MAG: hypothetical protein IPP40_08290 [bacterium]|nr:hypothetical protein [bacterium]